MEFKGTKGEWEVSKNNPKMILTDLGAYKPNAMMLSLCSKIEMESNAKLIAAAPELLRVLQLLVDDNVIQDSHYLDIVEKTIYKALK